MTRAPLAVCAAGLVALLGPAASAGAHDGALSDAVGAWNINAGKAAVAACISPVGPSPAEARMYAMTHVAIHDALNAIDRRSEPYVYRAHVRRRTSPDAAVAAAAHDVLVPILGQLSALVPQECITAAVAGVETDYDAALDAVPDGRAKDRGVALGRDAAAAILDLRETDGAQELLTGDPLYPQGTTAGRVPLHPNRRHTARLRPAPRRDAALRPAGRQPVPPRPAVPGDEPAVRGGLNEIQRQGGDGVITPSARSPEQTQVALFWVESSPLQWNRIARTVAVGAGLDQWEKARLLGLLNMSLIDGYIGTFEAKYHYLFWRPVTAIRLANTDGNAATSADPTWTPLVETPPIPDHDSGHAVEGGAAAAVLRRFFHTDRAHFSTCSTTLPDGSNCDDGDDAVFRHYRSFSQAAEENGESRILVGFHFRHAVDDGITHGRKIGDRAVARFMQPQR